MCTLLDLNDDCLSEIFSYLGHEDRLMLSVVSDRFDDLITKDLKKYEYQDLYFYLFDHLQYVLEPDEFQRVCENVTKLDTGAINYDTVVFFEDFGKYFKNLEHLTLGHFFAVRKDDYKQLEPSIIPLLGQLKSLHVWCDAEYQVNMIKHTKSLEKARFLGQNPFRRKTKTLFFENNKKSLQSLWWRDHKKLQICSEDMLKNISMMECLKKVYLDPIESIEDYAKLMEAFAKGNVLENLEITLGTPKKLPANLSPEFGPSLKMTSLKKLKIVWNFKREFDENFTINNLPNVEKLDLNRPLSTNRIIKLLQELPLLNHLIQFRFSYDVDPLAKFENYLAKQNRRFRIFTDSWTHV